MQLVVRAYARQVIVGGSTPLAVIKYLSLPTLVVVFGWCVSDAPPEFDPVGFMMMKTSKERLS